MPFARVKIAGRMHEACAVSASEGLLSVAFDGCDVRAAVRAETRGPYLTLGVESLSDEGIEELAFLDVPLALSLDPHAPFAACALALNLQTNVAALPGATDRLTAWCYQRFGFAGAKAAIIACPRDLMRGVMQQAVSDAPDLPHSPMGGPWALDAPAARGSYLFNHGGLTEETVDSWINLAHTLGFDQVDFHGGRSFRFGDCEPNPAMYPRGFDSLKAVIDRLHEAGLLAGLHTYAFFMDKQCPWVTPVPDDRLGKDATFTLAEPLSVESTSVAVVESTEAMSAITGFFVRNSVTLRVDDELITYKGVREEPPYAFTDCERGACGTRVAEHEAGARVHHLKECFGYFAPDGDSTLLAEVAAQSAEAFNRCGFDMMYLDALDGEDILGGRENGWHYGSKFVFELWRRLDRPALMEMSTFRHHLWCVRSRIGAWDHPTRGYKRFIDLHCASNDPDYGSAAGGAVASGNVSHHAFNAPRMFLPAHLGWWSLSTGRDTQREPTMPDDIEYLCCKSLGTDTGFSLMGIEPESLADTPAFARQAAIVGRYERLRRSGCVPAAVRRELAAPGREFMLVETPEGRWRFVPVHYSVHKVEGSGGCSSAWRVDNPFGRQPLRLRIEALASAAPYDASASVAVFDPGDAQSAVKCEAAEGVTVDMTAVRGDGGPAPIAGCLRALNTRQQARGAWAAVHRRFDPPLDVGGREALGVWVRGDGRGELLNVQLRSPEHISGAFGDHYITVDFTGWRYCGLVEAEGERYSQHEWPYGSAYTIYRQSVNLEKVESVSLWYNDLPPGCQVVCDVGPVRALPLVCTGLRRPRVTVGDQTITFPVEMETGSYIEFNSTSDCRLYGPRGELLADIQPEGEAPVLAEGENRAEFGCEVTPDVAARARITVSSLGEPLAGSYPTVPDPAI